jgi:type II restriction enzyme
MKQGQQLFLTKSGIIVSVSDSDIEKNLSGSDIVDTINISDGSKRKYRFDSLKFHNPKRCKGIYTFSDRQKKAPLLNKRLRYQVDNLIPELINKYHKYNVTFLLDKDFTKDQLIDYLDEYYGVNRHQNYFDTTLKTSMIPDGGILWMLTEDGKKYPILITEMKSQGEGKDQSRGNAIERAGKNIIFVNLLLLFEKEITPFVIFAQGDDFKKGSSILGRASILNNSQPLNVTNIHSNIITSSGGKNNPNQISIETQYLRRFAFMAQEHDWTDDEILEIIQQVSYQAIDYFLNK